jgi:hypothetical protein
MRSPGSILEIDTETVDDKVHFKRFFVVVSKKLLMVLEMAIGHTSA